MQSTRELVDTVVAEGTLRAIVVRPGRREPARTIDHTRALVGRGLADDRHAARSRPRSRRQVTLVQAEHLPVVAALAGLDRVDPTDLRRNLVVAGLNLLSTKGRRVQVGDAILEVTGPCHPCSRMEETLGPGGFQAVRGHGGMTARVVVEGEFTVGDRVAVLPRADPEGPLGAPDAGSTGTNRA